MSVPTRSGGLPTIIQGGMGVGVSGWTLARSVALAGQLGVVSGTALDVVHARRLADGDLGGHLRRAYQTFPSPEIVDQVLDRWFIEGGRDPSEPYRPTPMFRAQPSRANQMLTVLANYAEVWLAKEGHDHPVGINYLEKVQIPTPVAAYGAMLADVDVVLMGAGIPAGIPRLLDGLARGERVAYRIDVVGATHTTEVVLDPATILGDPPVLRRPAFLAIVGSHTLATYLAKDPATRPDGFVVEGPTAGGHNAPPRGRMQLDEDGQPIYGPRDQVDPAKMVELGMPFWLAGGYGNPHGLVEALSVGAAGVQVGTAFALCEESGLAGDLRQSVIDHGRDGSLTVSTDPLASPSGYPFKVAAIETTLAEPGVYADRERVCDLGFLRTAYERPDGTIGFRCASEPVDHYVDKGGNAEETGGRMCLCNGLMATVGLPQLRRRGTEPAVVTMGDDASAAIEALSARYGSYSWSAADVVEYLLDAPVSPAPG